MIIDMFGGDERTAEALLSEKVETDIDKARRWMKVAAVFFVLCGALSLFVQDDAVNSLFIRLLFLFCFGESLILFVLQKRLMRPTKTIYLLSVIMVVLVTWQCFIFGVFILVYLLSKEMRRAVFSAERT